MKGGLIRFQVRFPVYSVTRHNFSLVSLLSVIMFISADGNFEVTLATKATIYHQGLVEWKPPAIYKSSCEIDVEYFPFDEQTCVLKFGSWTYDGFKVSYPPCPLPPQHFMLLDVNSPAVPSTRLYITLLLLYYTQFALELRLSDCILRA
ncbi:hypothetical protein Trydic_g1244 [Trypoxylus dichotomus]